MKHALNSIAALLLLLTACSKPAPAPAPVEPETLSRTEFTNRVENYFEYEPLRRGKPSEVRIHLTDLQDGTPVEKADVTLAIKAKGSTEPATETNSRVGKVAGIYVASVTVARAGEYDIEFHIKNDKLDERMPLMNFKVE